MDPVNLNDTFDFGPVSHTTPCAAPQHTSVVQQHLLSNPISEPLHTSVIQPPQLVPTIQVQPPLVLSDKTKKHFGGFMHEDASKFMKEFDST